MNQSISFSSRSVRQANVFLLFGMLIIISSGCARFVQGRGFEQVQQIIKERTGQRIKWQPTQKSAAERMNKVIDDMLGHPLTAETAVQIALLNNRSLQATYEDLGIAQADLVQAGLLKNPGFDFEIRFPAHPKSPLEAHVIQDFLDVVYLPLRKKAARQEFEAAKLRVTHEVLRVAAETKEAFYDYQAAQQMVEMRNSITAATEASSEAARRLYRAGNITDLALAEEKAIHGEARLELSQAQQDAVDKKETLNQFMGLWGNQVEWKAEDQLPAPPAEEMKSEGLENFAIARRLDLAAARQEILARARNLDLNRLVNLFPDASVGAHYEREPDGTGTAGPSIGFPLPLFDWGQARRGRALAQLRQNQERYLALAVEIRSKVRQGRNRMEQARQRARFYQEVQLPLRHEAVEQAQLQYNGMQIGVIELLRVKREEIEAGRRYIEALHDYWEARADLEEALGGNLPQNAFISTESKANASPQTETKTGTNPEPAEQGAQALSHQDGGMHHHE